MNVQVFGLRLDEYSALHLHCTRNAKRRPRGGLERNHDGASASIQSTCFQYVATGIKEIIIRKGGSAIVLDPTENQKTLGTFGKTVSQFMPSEVSFCKEKKTVGDIRPISKEDSYCTATYRSGGRTRRQKASIADEGAGSTLWKDQSLQHIRARFLVRSK